MNDASDDGLAFTTIGGGANREVRTIVGNFVVGRVLWIPESGTYCFRGSAVALSPDQLRSIADYCEKNATLRNQAHRWRQKK